MEITRGQEARLVQLVELIEIGDGLAVAAAVRLVQDNRPVPDDAHVGRGRFPTKEEKIATLVHGASRVVTTKDELLYS